MFGFSEYLTKIYTIKVAFEIPEPKVNNNFKKLFHYLIIRERRLRKKSL